MQVIKRSGGFASIALLLLLICSVRLGAQSTTGITGTRDTSYTNYAAYNSIKKAFPGATIVGEVRALSVKEERGISYCTVKGRQLLLDVFQPSAKAAKKRAAVIIIHGGGWRSGNRAQHYPLAQRLAAQGYVCFTPEYRLSTEALFPAAVHDLNSAVRWVHAQAKAYNIDTTKIAVLGFSAGGQLAALLGTTMGDPYFEGKTCHPQASSRVQAIIDLDGTLSFVHPESGEGDDSKKPSAATLWFGYAKKENANLWQAASPLTHVNRHTPPTLFINSSVARMHAGRDDFIKVLNDHAIYSEVKTFDPAPHHFPLFQPWFDPMVKHIHHFLQRVFERKKAAVPGLITVAQDGTGDYTKVQDAFNAIPVNNKDAVTVFIKKGVYKEKLRLDSTKRHVTLTGEDKFKTILSYDDHAGKRSPGGDTINTFTSYSFLLEADDFKAQYITFENTAGNSAGQAVAMHIMGDRVQFKNCRFLGHQDVLYAGKSGSRQYFYKCYIEGTTDFILGPSIAWFQNCHINSKRNSHITAASTPKEQAFGYVFNDCVLTSDSVSVDRVSLGRPWRPYSNVSYIRCYMGNHILPEGWNNWRKEENEKTARYAEYQSYGPGANPTKRFGWTKQLDDNEMKVYSIPNVFGDWDPLKTVWK